MNRRKKIQPDAIRRGAEPRPKVPIPACIFAHRVRQRLSTGRQQKAPGATWVVPGACVGFGAG